MNKGDILKEFYAGLAVVIRNFDLVKRYWKWEIVFFAYTIANTVTMGFVGKSMGGGNRTILYMIIGATMWSYLSVLFEVLAETVAWERWEGTIEYTFMSPMKRITHLLGTCGFAIVYGMLRTFLLFIIVAPLFGINLGSMNVSATLMVLAIASISFTGFGMMGAVLPLISPEKGVQVVHIFQAFILMISGVYYSVNVMPKWMETLSYFSPATYALEAMRKTVLNGEGIWSIMDKLAPMALMGMLFLPLGLFIFKWGERFSKRKGFLKRNG